MAASIALPLPIFDNQRSFKAWFVQFEGFCAISNISPDDQLKLLPLCFTGKRFDAIFEGITGHTTLKSITTKLENFIRQENRPSDPLQFLMDCHWQTHQTSFDFIRELRIRAGYITKIKDAINDLVRVQIRRTIGPELHSIVLLHEDIDELAQHLSLIPRPASNSSHSTVAALHSTMNRKVICYNCDIAGHTCRRCNLPKSKCESCNKNGHLSKFCDKFPKNPK
jgi:hypothetical protein